MNTNPAEKKSILIVTRYFPPARGGTEAYTYHLARGLAELGESVIVVAPEEAGGKRFDAGQIFSTVRFPGNKNRITRIFQMYRAAGRVLRNKPIDLMLATTWSPAGVVARLQAKRYRVPYFVIAHGTELYAHRSWNRLRKAVFSSAAGLIANSDYTRRRLLRLGVHSPRISIVRPAVDINKFQKGTEALPSSGRAETVTLLTVTRLTPKKGVDMVLRILPEVISRIGSLRYVVIGRGEDRDRLEKITRDLNLRDAVKFTGRVSDEELVDYYRQSDLFVLVSREEEEGLDYEGFGIVFLEAAACGKPVVGGRSGGIPEAIEDGVTGLLVDPLAEEDISRAIMTLLTDRRRAGEMGEAGRIRVEEKFSYLAQARRVREIIR